MRNIKKRERVRETMIGETDVTETPEPDPAEVRDRKLDFFSVYKKRS